LAANQIAMPAGTYIVDISSPAFDVNRHKCRLYDITNAVTLLVGSSENTSTATSTHICTRSVIKSVLTLAAPITIELQHRCDVTQSSNGFGKAASFGEIEVYAELFIETL